MVSFMNDINKFIIQATNDRESCIQNIERIEDDDQYLRTNYEGLIKEDTLVNLINQSRYDSYLERFLSALSINLTAQEVTPIVFQSILNHKGKYSKSILIGLAHCNLSYYQLVQLNKLQIDEALIQLVDKYTQYDCFTRYDLQEMLTPWKNKMPNYLRDYICTKTAHKE